MNRLNDDLSDITQIARQLVPQRRRDAEPRLVVVAGGAPRTHRVQTELIIGRGSDATVLLDCPGVSRCHSRIRHANGEYIIEDLGSKNGTFVNGNRVASARLAAGDEIRIGAEGKLLFAKITVLENQFIEQQKMEAIGRLSAGVAHEFNNLLAIVVASLEYLQTLPDAVFKREDVAQSLTDAIVAASQATVVTRGLLDFSRPAKGESDRVDVGNLLSNVVQLVRRTFSRNIRVDLSAEAGLDVEGDASLLLQSMMNLCLNARDAMPSGGTLTLTARAATSNAGARSVRVEVSDTGVGMTEAEVARVFEPFFTTKAEGNGTGLGLALVYGVVRTHGGEITAESAVGKGTTFRIDLPAAKMLTPRPRQNRETLSMKHAARARDANVLLVDDEPLVRRSCARIIQRAGFSVTTCVDGREAINLFSDPEQSFDVVVLDLNMPGLDGAQTLERLKAEHPDVRVIILSGYAEREREALLKQGVVAVLTKPCPLGRLADAIVQAVDSHDKKGRAHLQV